jgi:Fic family protein
MDRPDDAGVYRRIQVRALDDAHKPPPPQLVPRRMEQLLAENREKKTAMHPLERIAWFHLKFEDIHPFLGGNGRVGRLVMNFDLMRNDYLPVNVKLSERAEYFRAFDQWHRAGDPEPMVRLLAAHEEEQLARCLRALS